MLLYHYNHKPLKELKSMFARGLEKEGFELKEEYKGTIKEKFAYNKNLSFFLEPIPRDLPEILNHEHGFWKKGTVVYEHIVKLDNLPKDIHYRLVESRLATDLIFNKQNWDLVENNPRLKQRYLDEIKALELEKKYIGYSLRDLKQGIFNLPHDIREDYKQSYLTAKANPELDMLAKYASNVPHLMAYPAEIPVKVESVSKVVF